ncbi:MAG: hypothetical protein ACJAR1_001973 [Rubritalea sp.]|jgi:hypothetical protein
MTLTHKSISLFALLQCSNSALTAAPDFDLSIHGNATGGITDGSHQRTGIHAHDPNKDYNLQGLELGLTLREGEYIEGFLNMNVFLDQEDKFENEWEEGFLKFKNLPLPFSGDSGTLEVRAGFYLNRLGTENNVHLHGWDFINANLSTGMFLGEEGLRTEGAEVSWMKELDSGHISISGSYGKAMEHEHGHGDEHDDDHEDEHEDEHDDDEHDDHEENESLEKAYFNEDLVSVRAQILHNNTDFYYHRAGVSFAQGGNGYGRDTSLIGADYTFTWKENGLESGGKEISAGIEYFNRNVEWQDEIDSSINGDTGQQSLALKTSYAWNETWRVAARYEWVEGALGDVFITDEYQRASLAVTHSRQLSDDWSTVTRLQFNHDKIGNDHNNNLYLQLGFNFGGSEVR